MAHLGAMIGNGRILLGEEDVGAARYEIHVYRQRTLLEGRGEIEAEGSIIRQIEAAKGAILRLQDGQTIRILLKRHDVLASRADVVVTGPIPGF